MDTREKKQDVLLASGNGEQEFTYNFNTVIRRKPIGIFQYLGASVVPGTPIVAEGDYGKKYDFFDRLKCRFPLNYRLGAAVANGDCFFDSIAQGLNELKNKGLIENSKNFNVKSLREDCADYARQYKNEIIEDAIVGGYSVILEGQCDPVKNQVRREYNIDREKTLNRYLLNISNTGKERSNPIWGRIEIEGRIISKKYDIGIYFYSPTSDQDTEVIVRKVTRSEYEIRSFMSNENLDDLQINSDKKFIALMLYKGHFVPLLSNIQRDIREEIVVPIEKVYGVAKEGEKELNVNEPGGSNPLLDIEGDKLRSYKRFFLGETKKRGSVLKFIELNQGKKDKLDKFNQKFYTFSSSYHKECVINLDKCMHIFCVRAVSLLEAHLLKFSSRLLDREYSEGKYSKIFKKAVGGLKPLSSVSVGIIPFFEECFGYLGRRYQRNKTKRLTRIIHEFVANQESYRSLFIEAFIKIFSGFEEQFAICLSRDKDDHFYNALYDLADDAVHRVLHYFAQNPESRLCLEDMEKGVVRGNSKDFKGSATDFPNLKRGHNTYVNTELFFASPGLIIDGSYYVMSSPVDGTSLPAIEDCGYGFRKCFDWEKRTGFIKDGILTFSDYGNYYIEQVPEPKYEYQSTFEQRIKSKDDIESALDSLNWRTTSNIRNIIENIGKVCVEEFSDGSSKIDRILGMVENILSKENREMVNTVSNNLYSSHESIGGVPLMPLTEEQALLAESLHFFAQKFLSSFLNEYLKARTMLTSFSEIMIQDTELKVKLEKFVNIVESVPMCDLEKLLLEAAIQVYQAFEKQLYEIKIDSYLTRLSYCAALRVIDYIHNQDIKLLSCNVIIKGIIFGYSDRSLLSFKYHKRDVNANEIYSKTAVLKSEKEIFSYCKDYITEYGFRLPLSFEKAEEKLPHPFDEVFMVCADSFFGHQNYSYRLAEIDVENECKLILDKVKATKPSDKGDIEDLRSRLSILSKKIDNVNKRRHDDGGDDRGGRHDDGGDDRGGRHDDGGDDRGGRHDDGGDDRGGRHDDGGESEELDSVSNMTKLINDMQVELCDTEVLQGSLESQKLKVLDYYQVDGTLILNEWQQQEIQIALAVEQAVLYMRNQGCELGINEYLKQYKIKEKTLFGYELFRAIDNDYIKKVIITLQMLVDSVASDKQYGKLSLEVLNVLLCLQSQNVDREIFMKLAGNNCDSLKSALCLLVRHSIVHDNQEQGVLTVNIWIKEVVMRKLLKLDGRAKIFKLIQDIFNDSTNKDFGKQKRFLAYLHKELFSFGRLLSKEHQNDKGVEGDFLEPFIELMISDYLNLCNARRKRELLLVVLPFIEVFCGVDTPAVPEVLLRLAKISCYLSDTKGEIEYLKAALPLLKKFYGSDSASVFHVLKSISRACMILGSDKSDKEHFNEVFSFVKKLDKSHLKHEIAELLVIISVFYFEVHDHEKHKQCLEQALLIFESLDRGSYGCEMVEVLIKLSMFYREVYDHEKHKRCLERALLILESFDRYSYSHEISGLLISVSNAFSVAFADEMRIGYLQRILFIARGVCGTGSIAEAISLFNLSMAYEDGNLQEKFNCITSALSLMDHIESIGEGCPEKTILLLKCNEAIANTFDDEKRIQYFERILPIIQRFFGCDSFSVAQILLKLAGFYESLGNHERQRKHLEDVLPILKKLRGSEIFVTVNILMKLAQICKDLGDDKSQGKYLEDVLPILKKLHGPENSEVVDVLLKLSVVHELLGNCERQRKHLEDVLPILKKLRGPENSEVVDVLLKLSVVHEFLGNRERQRKYLEDVLPILKKLRGSETSEVVDVLMNLVKICEDLNDDARERKYLEDALVLFRSIDGPGSNRVAVVLSSLIEVCEDLGDYESQRKYLEELLHIVKVVGGPNIIVVNSLLMQLSIVSKRLENYQAERKYLEELLPNLRQFYNSEEHLKVEVLLRLIDICDRLSYDERKWAYVKEVQPALEGIYCRNVLLTSCILVRPDGVCGYLKDDEGQSEYLKSILPAIEKVYGPNSSEIAVLKFKLAKVCEDLGSYKNQRKYLEQLLPISEELHGPSSLATTSVLLSLGMACVFSSDDKKGIEYFEKYLSIIKKHYPSNASIISVVLMNISVAYSREGNHQKQIEYLEESLAVRVFSGHDYSQVEKVPVSNDKISNYHQSKKRYLSKALSSSSDSTISKSGTKKVCLNREVTYNSVAYSREGNHQKQIEYLEESSAVGVFSGHDYSQVEKVPVSNDKISNYHQSRKRYLSKALSSSSDSTISKSGTKKVCLNREVTYNLTCPPITTLNNVSVSTHLERQLSNN